MLNARLLACAAYIRPGAHVCDVGTDHAQLPVYLIGQGIAEQVIASDIGEGPLMAAERTIVKHGLTEKIRTILSDGLQQIPPDDLTDVIIAGMGGETMIHILESCPWQMDSVSWILQPMTKANLLREWLYLHGFEIQEECCVRDDRYLYAVMHAVYTGIPQQPDTVTRYIGKINIRIPEGRAYAERQYAQLCKARDGRLRAGQDASPYAEDAEAIGSILEGAYEGSGRI